MESERWGSTDAVRNVRRRLWEWATSCINDFFVTAIFRPPRNPPFRIFSIYETCLRCSWVCFGLRIGGFRRTMFVLVSNCLEALGMGYFFDILTHDFSPTPQSSTNFMFCSRFQLTCMYNKCHGNGLLHKCFHFLCRPSLLLNENYPKVFPGVWVFGIFYGGCSCGPWGQSLTSTDRCSPGGLSMSRAFITATSTKRPTPRGFEPLRAEPNGFRVHLLSRSDTVSCDVARTAVLERRKSPATRLRQTCFTASLAVAPGETFGRTACTTVCSGGGCR